MWQTFRSRAALAPAILIAATGAPASPTLADDPPVVREADVIYGRKFGTALTLDVFRPTRNPNGAGIVALMSGGWHSDHDWIKAESMRVWTDRGYAVFAVVHGSEPKFTIPEAAADVARAVRFVRSRARGYGVDPDRLGITGSSAGGHLSLMIGTAGPPANPGAADPVDRESSRVAAVGCFFPPTDFLNYGKDGEPAIGDGTLADYPAPFDFREYVPARRRFVSVEDPAKRRDIARLISPISHVDAGDPPTLIVHGDRDKLVPIQQAEVMVKKLKEAGVEATLIVKEGGDHGWPGMDREQAKIADFFDAHLKPATKAPPAEAAP